MERLMGRGTGHTVGMFERLINWQANRRGVQWFDTRTRAPQNDVDAIYPGECGHGNPVRVCAVQGLCAIEETERLEEWWALSTPDAGYVWLMRLVAVVWFGFGIMMAISTTAACMHGQVRQAAVSAALFGLMACGAYGWRKVS